MTILYILVPAALVVILVAVVAFAWAARRGQFDDLETPAIRMLRDDLAAAGRRREAPTDRAD